MSKHVCVLARWEVKEFVEENAIPNCSKHKHVKVSEAIEMTGGGQLYFKPIAKWVGAVGEDSEDKLQITMLGEHLWVRKRTQGGWGPDMYNLVER
jgi:hypothetical protein